VKKLLNQDQLCSAYELFYRLLFNCDPAGRREDRARHLLEVLLLLDAMGGSIPQHDFSDLVGKATLACGFADEDEAWDALMQLVDPAILWEQGSFLNSGTPFDRSGSN